MMFNKRRQSRDSVLIKDLLTEVEDKTLWIDEYSKKLFEDVSCPNLQIDENLLELAKDGEYCFIENKHLGEYRSKIEQLIVYHWNRSYPADFSFDLELLPNEWELVDSKEFAGSSHENILREIFKFKGES
ncbi:hypothetical protein P261_02110 [Lachnospiraceae bacterium TWA4]|nr:hypothetical protein P261_02110 [Lachnospiraceae bacterium TWA4]